MMANRKEILSLWLSDLLGDLTVITTDRQVTGLSLDSRNLRDGDLFFAVSGVNSHGSQFALEALSKGAVGIVCDVLDTTSFMDKSITPDVLFEIPQLSKNMGLIAARFYGDPSKKCTVFGVTGTNGKTSCVQFLQQCLPNSSSIGTLGWGVGTSLAETKNTTPDAIELQEIMSQLQGQGIHHIAMEVSSHALQQQRVSGTSFDGVMITNITQDHLDYHGCMDDYVAAKLTLLSAPDIRFAVVNCNDDFYDAIVAAIPDYVEVWGVTGDEKHRDGINVLKIGAVICNWEGISFDVEYHGELHRVTVPVYGAVNVENVAMVMAVLLAHGYSFIEACVRIQKVHAIAGRMEVFKSRQALPAIIVDYAHTPDALEKLLLMAREHCDGNIWLVFGCGGDRDVGKRSQMGLIAEQYADHIIVTNDNPRTESEQKIVRDIVSLCDDSGVEIIYNRRRAIQETIEKAKTSDCVVIAGKGHEKYQEVQGERIALSDREIVTDLVANGGRLC